MKAIKARVTPLKDLMVEYVGEKLQPEADAVTYEMVVSVLAEEFPEVVVFLAEENYLRGYQKALEDTVEFDEAYEEFYKEPATE